MRIIAGTHRSRVILSPPDDGTTRPITDRVKTALFDRLVSMEALGAAAVDVFSGTGSLGLEALSRGVDHCTFIERDRESRRLLQQNIDTLGLAERAVVLGTDALSGAWIAQLPRRPVELVFLDPPYAMTEDAGDRDRLAALLTALARAEGAASDDALAILRTSDRGTAPKAEGWSEPEPHAYGSMTLHFYSRKA